ncbi:DNA-binding domain-containing protein [Aquincola sp. MAHUQ-54]|uniref:DNA-binding domain-containing protein n=1 Tax=Aquincola agrisoli TaxID=3119538 RepID=A0AAW9QHI7_9BURK
MSAEARRQQALLAALQGGGLAALPPGALRGPRAGVLRGLQVYQANAGAAAQGALAAAFPTVAALVGDAAMAGLARAYWRAHPPQAGDLGAYGAQLPAFIAGSPTLADEPYLADSAALDWALHQAARAADEPPGAQQLERLGDTEPAVLRLQLRAGTALLRSRWPIVSIWQAHQAPAGAQQAGGFAAVREALRAGRGEDACVWREGWHARAAAVAPADALFTQALLDGRPLDAALDAAGSGFDFAGWLGEALRRDRIAAVVVVEGDKP